MTTNKTKKNILISKSTKGFTLVEMLVAIAIFMSVMVSAVGALISIIHANSKAQSIKTVIDNVTFAVDSISRNVRQGTNYSCLTDLNGSTQTPNDKDILMCSGIGIIYTNPDSTFTQYRFVNAASIASDIINSSATTTGNIQRRNCDSNGCTLWQSVTAPTSNINITSMAFTIYGAGLTQQPRVLITTDGFIMSGGATTTEFYLQTTASERIRNE